MISLDLQTFAGRSGLALHLGAECLSSGSHICVANTLQVELSPPSISSLPFHGFFPLEFCTGNMNVFPGLKPRMWDFSSILVQFIRVILGPSSLRWSC